MDATAPDVVTLRDHLEGRSGPQRAPHALVIGATGYVGRHVVEGLRRDDIATTAHVRPGSSRAGLAAGFEGDGAGVEHAALEVEPLRDVMRSLAPTHVFLCHGTTAKRARAEGIEDPYETVDVGVTRIVVDAARGAEDPPRLVYLSSMGAGGRGAYLAARGKAEQLIRDSGLSFTLCRAPLITGPDRDEGRPLERVGAALSGPTLRLLGALGLRRLRGRYHPMDAREVAEGLIRSGFHHMTIDRVVLADELRRLGVYELERWHPRSQRDAGRH